MANSKKLPSNKLVNHVADKLKKWVKPNQHIVIGLSGGLDSVVLLNILSRLTSLYPFKLSATHCNHQISSNADSWVNFCEALCEQHNVPLQIFTLDLTKYKSHEGLEAIARQARYAAFAELKVEFIALAHHLDDQTETLFLRLLRGAGVKGLSAMTDSRILSRQHSTAMLIRPLLDIPRKQLMDYALEHKLKWIEDESNLNTHYSRNFLRHEVFPKIEKHFPAYRETLARAAQNFSTTSKLLEELAQLDAQETVINNRLQLSKL